MSVLPTSSSIRRVCATLSFCQPSPLSTAMPTTSTSGAWITISIGCRFAPPKASWSMITFRLGGEARAAPPRSSAAARAASRRAPGLDGAAVAGGVTRSSWGGAGGGAATPWRGTWRPCTGATARRRGSLSARGARSRRPRIRRRARIPSSGGTPPGSPSGPPAGGPLGDPEFPPVAELLRGHPAVHRQVLLRRPQVLADRQDVQAVAGKVAQRPLDLLPALGELVPGDARDDAVAQPHRGHGVRDAGGLAQVQLGGAPGLHRAEAAGAGADVAQDHHRRRSPRPAFAQVRALGALADRVEPSVVHEAAHGGVAGAGGKPGSQPVGLAGRVHGRAFVRVDTAEMDTIAGESQARNPRKFPFAHGAALRQVYPLT